MKTRGISNNWTCKFPGDLKQYRSLFIAGFVLSLLSCKPIKTLVNKEFPPFSASDQQYASVERNLRVIKTFDAHVGVHVDKDLILNFLPAEIRKSALAAGNEDLSIKELDPDVSFDEQGVFIDADFLLFIPKYKVDVKGNFKGVTSISTENDTLYLSSAFTSLKVNNLKFHEKPKITGNALAKLLTSLLRNFIENANGEFLRKPVAIYAGWGEVYKLRLKEIVKGPDTEISLDSIVVSRAVKKSSVRINSNGVSVMVELTEKKPAADSVKEMPFKSRTGSELTKLFKSFDKKFDSLWAQSFEIIDKKSFMTVNVSKAEIATILNAALSKPFSVKQRFEIPATTFNEKLEVKRGDIDCQKVRTDFSYPDFNGDKCDWDCMHTITVGVCPFCKKVRVEDPVCAASRKACIVKREAERIVWQGKREAARIAHQIENEAKVGACNVWRETMDFLALGRFKGSVSVNGNAMVYFNSLKFDPELTHLNLDYSGKVDAKLKSELEMNPVDLGHVFFCYTGYDKKISSDINVTIPASASRVKISSERDNEQLLLKIKPEQISYKASINPSPLHVMLLDPVFAAKCPIRTLLGVGAGAAITAKFLGLVKLAPEQELLLTGQVKGKYGIDEMRVPIEPITFKINGEVKKSLLFWNPKSIQAKYPKPSAKETPEESLVTNHSN